jgi:hypothetical protein
MYICILSYSTVTSSVKNFRNKVWRFSKLVTSGAVLSVSVYSLVGSKAEEESSRRMVCVRITDM